MQPKFPTQTAAPEFSRTITLHEIDKAGQISLDIQANSTELQALATRLKLLEITQLHAHLDIRPASTPKAYIVEGEFQADLVQECCVTFAPVFEHVAESNREVLTSDKSHLRTHDLDENAPLDLIENGVLDIGELITQWLSLALDPFPRSEAPLYAHIEAVNQSLDSPSGSPFSALLNLQKSLENTDK